MRNSFGPMPIPAAGLAEGDQVPDAHAIVVAPAATYLQFGEGFKHRVFVFRRFPSLPLSPHVAFLSVLRSPFGFAPAFYNHLAPKASGAGKHLPPPF